MKRGGGVNRNKYDMEMIDCRRGENRTETFHKNLLMTFGGWHTDVKMSTCLLSEQRYRQNCQCSELRRSGFPCIVNYDIWLMANCKI